MPTVCPPSTTRAYPIAKPPRSEQSHSAADAIFSGFPIRPIGSWAITRALPSGVPPEKRSIIGVAMIHGQIALIRMPSAAYSSAADLVMPSTPCFVAAYPA